MAKAKSKTKKTSAATKAKKRWRKPSKEKKTAYRGMWKGSISFGLVNIPISLVSAEEAEKIHFRLLDKKDNAPVGYKNINKRTGREIQRSQIVKGYEAEKGEFVIMTDADFKKANVRATSTIDIEDFVGIDDIDPLLFERPYYIVPREGGEKGYVLLREVLKRTEKSAIAKVVLHTVQRLTSIMVRGDYLILEILRFADEVKEVDEVDFLDDDVKNTKVSEREVAVATQLVEGMTSPWNSDKYRNTYREDLMKLIKAKMKKGTTSVEDISHDQIEETETNVVDLTELLKKSLGTTKKSKKGTA